MTNKSKEFIYLDVESNKLQEFFAVLAYIEVNPNNIFLYDDHNKFLLIESRKFYDFELIKKNKIIEEYKLVYITVDHEAPQTKITGYPKAPVIFPKVIGKRFYRSFNKKENKIYFRGLFTLKRLYEMILLFIKIFDFKALTILLTNIAKLQFEFIINTNKVYMRFSKRGRQSQFKYLDESYYEEMSRFKYVFCPIGDFIWTYRFFEAIQLGSIPLCTYSSDSYKNFYYLSKRPVSGNDYSSQEIKNSLLFRSQFNLQTLGNT